MQYPCNYFNASGSTEEPTAIAVFTDTSTDMLFSSCLLLLFIIIIIIIIIMCMSLTYKVALFPKTSSYHEIYQNLISESCH